MMTDRSSMRHRAIESTKHYFLRLLDGIESSSISAIPVCILYSTTAVIISYYSVVIEKLIV